MDAIQQQSMDLAREERRRAQIVMLAALRRLDEDEFGYCLACGERISLQRLEIDPAVTLCVDCQR